MGKNGLVYTLIAAGVRLLLMLGLLLPVAPGYAQTAPPRYPLTLSADGSYLVDQNNQPFFMNGDAAWSLIAAVSREDAEIYLENRRQKGFTLVLVNLLEHSFSPNPPSNYYGQPPFTSSGNFDTPNEAYFAHADWVINKAAEKGIVVLLAPLYLGYECGGQGWCGEVRASSLTTMRNYGRYVGNRYRSFPNILWLIGGDADPVAQGVASKVREFVSGLKETDPTHLVTAGNAPEQAAMTPWPNEAWLDLNNIYTYDYTYSAAFQQYNRSDRKPFFLLETFYEGEHNSTPLSLRRQAYWTVLSGGVLGHIFGNCQIWGFSWGFCTTPWQPQLESAGSTTIAYVGRLFQSRPFFMLVPDQTHQVLTSGYESGFSYAAAARASNGSTVIAYIPTQRTVTVNLSQISGNTVKAWWFNPRTAAATLIGTYPTTSEIPLTPPDQNDWVLVVDNAALNLPPPGTLSAPDALTIPRAVFAKAIWTLFVSATSSSSPDAALFVTVPNCLTDVPMLWSVNAYVLLRRVTSCANLDGQPVTVTSSYGGVATTTIR